MKKYLIAAALSALASSSFAGTVEFGMTSANIGGGYPAANNQALGVQTAVTPVDSLALHATREHQWGTTSMMYQGEATHQFKNGLSLTAFAGGSDTGVIAPKTRLGAFASMPVAGVEGLKVGAGYEHVGMRGAFAQTDTLMTQVSYTVPTLPLTLVGNANVQRVADDHNGMVYKLGAEYGSAGKWVAGVSAETGVSTYGNTVFPGATVGSYRSTTARATGRYWLSKDFGLTAEASRTKNSYYTQNEVGVGAFMTW